MNTSETLGIGHSPVSKYPRRNRECPVAFMGRAKELRAEIKQPFPRGGVAAAKLKELCAAHGLSLAHGSELLRLSQSRTDRLVHLHEDLGMVYDEMRECFPGITEPHLRVLEKLRYPREALQCLQAAYHANQGVLPPEVLSDWVNRSIASGQATARPRRRRGVSLGALCKLCVTACRKARKWNPAHPATSLLEQAVKLLDPAEGSAERPQQQG